MIAQGSFITFMRREGVKAVLKRAKHVKWFACKKGNSNTFSSEE
jgi:hypothetical protein